jgi:hypothetical protein
LFGTCDDGGSGKESDKHTRERRACRGESHLYIRILESLGSANNQENHGNGVIDIAESIECDLTQIDS